MHFGKVSDLRILLIKIALSSQRHSLQKTQETGDAAEQTVERDQTRVGRLSRMDAMQAQAMSVEIGRRRRQRLLQIEDALKYLDEDEYGYCQEFGKDIPLRRLEVDPAALHGYRQRVEKRSLNRCAGRIPAPFRAHYLSPCRRIQSDNRWNLDGTRATITKRLTSSSVVCCLLWRTAHSSRLTQDKSRARGTMV